MSTESVINGLNPIVANKARQLLALCHAENINVIFTQGLRTFAEQTALYNQGRTTPGQVVTNAKAGQSYHNYGLALDFALLDAKGNVYWTVDTKWKRVAELGKSLGFEWGGDWISFKDYPHLEYTFGFSVKDLQYGASIPTKEDFVMGKDETDFILEVLGYYWKEMQGNTEAQEYTHYVANALREATGRPKE